MMLHMNLNACTGCGVCIGACPAGAMGLVAGKAVINTELCTVCQTCIEVCPTGAIMVVTPPAQAALTAVPRPPAVAQPSQKPEAAPGGIALWTGIALALVEHRIVPRLAEVFIVALERWLSRPKPAPTTTSWQNALQGKVGRGPTYRHRKRGNHRE
jgi:NAD-dependent dihydropyrimidine dehydrogenase PreA subunit